MKRKKGNLRVKGMKAFRTVIHKQEHKPAAFKPKLEVSPEITG